MANFSEFYTIVTNKLLVSTTLAAVITDAIANHVRQERYVCISKDGPLNHDLYLTNGPIVYLIPANCEYNPMTEEGGRTEGVLLMDVHSRVINLTASTFVSHIQFVDDLIVELMAGADGTGGTSSWLTTARGLKLRFSSETPEQLSPTEYRTKVKIRATLIPSV